MQRHIGEKVLELVEERNINKTKLAEKLLTSRHNLYMIFERPDLDTGLLRRLCTELDFDFFKWVSGDDNVQPNQPSVFNDQRAEYHKPEPLIGIQAFVTPTQLKEMGLDKLLKKHL